VTPEADSVDDLGLRVDPTPRLIWLVSRPLILATFGETLIDVTDAAFLARAGMTELGAVAIADAIYETALFMVLGLIEGLQILIARRAGQGRTRDVGGVFNQGLYLLSLVSVVLFVAIRFLSPYVTATLVSADPVRQAADTFLAIVALAVFFEAVNMAYGALFVGLSRTGVLLAAAIVLAVTNIALDYCLIFGRWGAPALGIAGAAWASVAAEVAVFVFLTGYTLARLDTARYGLFHFHRLRRSVARLLLGVSSPAMLDNLMDSLRWFAFFVVVEHVGTDTLAWSNVIYSLYTLFLIPIGGISETACSMVSNVIGQGKERMLGTLMRRTASLGYLTSLPLAAVALAWPDLILAIFTTDPTVVDGCRASLRVVACGLLVIVPCEMAINAVAGTGDTLAVLVIEILTAIAFLGAVVVALGPLGAPLAVAWLAEVGAAACCLGLAAGWLRSGRWQRLRL
jgi:MATE family multidrug resistance protein